MLNIQRLIIYRSTTTGGHWPTNVSVTINNLVVFYDNNIELKHIIAFHYIQITKENIKLLIYKKNNKKTNLSGSSTLGKEKIFTKKSKRADHYYWLQLAHEIS